MTHPLAHWTAALSEAWGIDATLTSLPGEYDLNLLAIGRGPAASRPAGATDGGDARHGRWVLKVMRPGCDAPFVEMLAAAHAHVAARDPEVAIPRPVAARDGAHVVVRRDEAGAERRLWLLEALPGMRYAEFRPHSGTLLEALGREVARLDRALSGFAHPTLARELKWDLRRAAWIAGHLDALASDAQRALVAGALERFRALLPSLEAESVQAIHNDVNDHNVLVAWDAAGAPRIGGILDFGDLIAGPVAAELAITAAYAALEQPHPARAVARVVGGYHALSPLGAPTLALLWPLMRMRLAVSVVNAALMRRERPDDPYVTVSEAPAWRLLERSAAIPEAEATARIRVACGLAPTEEAGRVAAWLAGARGTFAPVVRADLPRMLPGSLAPADSAVPRDPFHLTADEAASLGHAFGEGSAWIGRYGEPRLINTGKAFRAGSHRAADRRTVHLGVDLFLPAGTAVYAPYDALVERAEIRPDAQDYGGVVVLRHRTADGDWFSTLYGHLSHATVRALARGQRIARGAPFAALGTPEENGGWAPHLHLQLLLDPEAGGADAPGVADPDDRAFWMARSPNPAPLLELADARVAWVPPDEAAMRAERAAHFATNLRLSYRAPLHLVRGWRTHLFDAWGRPYLDAYNNVPHVGHAHPRIRAVADAQLARLNTNTRYLHPALLEFGAALRAKLPARFTHVLLVNSGSEANELALRLARAATGARDMVVLAEGYHGNTTGALAISHYKFGRPNGGGAPEWVQVAPAPDPYRGAHRGADAGARYAAEVAAALARIAARGARPAGFIAETFPSVAGQLIPPPGYLAAAYDAVRAAGGLCIADEVQTGLGRLGAHYWGFEAQGVEPDVVVLGKPLGNGHPIGAVVTTEAVARAFDDGIEFFSTFGGSTLSCVVGREVLRIVDEEGLQGHAQAMGDRLLGGLRRLAERHEVIGEVRGMGLFVGVDLVSDRATRAPATAAAAYVVGRLREERILVGTEGPADNVLKIRPPLTIAAEDVDHLLATLDRVLGETPVATRPGR